MIPQSIMKAMEGKRDIEAELFEASVYYADPEMVDSNPSKLWSYGFDSGVSALYEHLKTVGGEKFDEKRLQAEAPQLIGTRDKYSQDGEKFGPGEEHLGWSYSPRDLKLFRKGAMWWHSLAVAREAVLVLENERLREALEKIHKETDNANSLRAIRKCWEISSEALAGKGK